MSISIAEKGEKQLFATDFSPWFDLLWSCSQLLKFSQAEQ